MKLLSLIIRGPLPLDTRGNLEPGIKRRKNCAAPVATCAQSNTFLLSSDYILAFGSISESEFISLLDEKPIIFLLFHRIWNVKRWNWSTSPEIILPPNLWKCSISKEPFRKNCARKTVRRLQATRFPWKYLGRGARVSSQGNRHKDLRQGVVGSAVINSWIRNHGDEAVTRVRSASYIFMPRCHDAVYDV